MLLMGTLQAVMTTGGGWGGDGGAWKDRLVLQWLVDGWWHTWWIQLPPDPWWWRIQMDGGYLVPTAYSRSRIIHFLDLGTSYFVAGGGGGGTLYSIDTSILVAVGGQWHHIVQVYTKAGAGWCWWNWWLTRNPGSGPATDTPVAYGQGGSGMDKTLEVVEVAWQLQ